ncbi:MFS transporter [Nocardiopsis sp. RSe5-2]|uniref:MFS transporter n=1 Tax=Nocardiopsis endophytica TaxID=3018445 RepID=A0ABT4U7Z3_9ACTN|nr:MFS transporter [Nocardiopsis endophytica]MDA2813061.1 MFS transporter [Nocardiopsis endophytica]
MLQSYRRLFAVPRLGALLFWSLAARLHIGGMPIAVTFLVAGWTGSYALAGLVAGGLTVGTALGGPIRGRMADRRPNDRLLLFSALVYGLGLTAMAFLPAWLWWAALPLAVATGVFQPPATQIGRSLWPRITSGPTRQAVFAAEATLQELLFIVGPLLAAAVVGVGGGRIGLLVLGAIACTGATGFALALRRAGHTLPHEAAGADGAPEASGGRRRSLLADPRLLLVIGVVMALVAGLGSVDLAMVAWARELGTPGYAGGLMAVYAFGSLVGGLAAGALAGPPRISLRAFGTAAGAVLIVPLVPPVLHLPSPWLITPVLFIAGLAIAPTVAAVTERLGDLAPPERRGEAYGWMTTATTGGIAIASPLTGWLIDHGGVALGLGGAAALATLAALLSLGIRTPGRTGPDGGPPTAGPAPAGPTGTAASPPPPAAPSA